VTVPKADRSCSRRLRRRRLLETIVDQTARPTLVGPVSLATQRLVDEIAREALADDEFRRSLHALVRKRSREILDDLIREERPRRRSPVRRRRRARRSSV
jgi:hypothetical protein